MSGLAVNILLGLAIVGLLVLITVLVKKYYTTFEGFFQTAPLPTVDIDAYMQSISDVEVQEGVEQQRDTYVCLMDIVSASKPWPDETAKCPTGYTRTVETPKGEPSRWVCKLTGKVDISNRSELETLIDTSKRINLGDLKCYPKCPANFIAQGSSCVPISSRPDARPSGGDVAKGLGQLPVCPQGFEFDPIGPRDPDCTPDGAGNTPKCKRYFKDPATGATKEEDACQTDPVTNIVTCKGSEPQPTCFPVCKDKMTTAGSKCVKPRDVTPQITLPIYSYSCPPGLRTWYIKIAGSSPYHVVIGQVIVIDENGKNIALTASPLGSSNRQFEKNPIDGTLVARDWSPTNGWNPADSDRAPSWKLLFDKENPPMIQSLTILSRKEEQYRGYMEGYFVTLYDINEKVLYTFPLTRASSHSWRFFTNGPSTYFPKFVADVGVPNGPLTVKKIDIGYKNDFLNLSSIEVYTIDYIGDKNPRRYNVEKSWITYAIVRNNRFSGVYGVNPTTNLVNFESKSNESPSIVIRFPSPILIDRIVINNNRSTPNALNGFIMYLDSDYGTVQSGYGRVWQTVLSSALTQTYQVDLSVRQEFDMCSPKCPTGYKSEKGSNTAITSSIKCVSLLDETKSYEKAFTNRIQTASCKTGVIFDNIRFPKQDGATNDTRCATTTPAKRTRAFYEAGLPTGYLKEDIDYLISQDQFTYCDLRGDEDIRVIREIRNNRCPEGYSWKWSSWYSNYQQLSGFRCMLDAEVLVSPNAGSQGWPNQNATCPAGYTREVDVPNGESPRWMCRNNRAAVVTEACPAGYIPTPVEVAKEYTKSVRNENEKTTVCIKKTQRDLNLEALGTTVDYSESLMCVQPCPDNYTLESATLTCRPNASLTTYKRDADRRPYDCPPGTKYDSDYKRCFGDCPGKQLAKGKYCYPEGTRMIDYDSAAQPFATYVPLSCPAEFELRADGLCYKRCDGGKIPVPGKCLPPLLEINKYGGNSTITTYDVEKLAKEIFSIDEFASQVGVGAGDAGFRAPRTNAPTLYKVSATQAQENPCLPDENNCTLTIPKDQADEKTARNNYIQRYGGNKNADFLNYPLFAIMANRESSAPLNLLYNWFNSLPAGSKYIKDSAAFNTEKDTNGKDVERFKITRIVYGAVNTAAAPVSTELASALSLAERVYLGAPTDVEKFIMVRWDDEKLYIRKAGVKPFFAPEAIQVYNKALRVFEIMANPDRNALNGDTTREELTPQLFASLTGPARTFIRKWAASRTNRILREKYANDVNTLKAKLTNYKEIDIPDTVKLQINKKEVLNDLAQTFYEYTNGRFVMTYIHDVHTLGTTMADIRFDFTEHYKDTDDTTKKLGLKMTKVEDTYRSITSATVTQNIVDEAKDNYQSTLADLQLAQAENTKAPVQGAVGRFFYTVNSISGKLMFNGMTLDKKVVSSFIRGLNGGLDVPTGTEPGNVNFSPITKYTKNAAAALNCSDIHTIKRIMLDYVDAVSDPESGIQYPAGTTQWDLSGTLVVNQITGIHKINNKPNQCAYSWTESVYDDTTQEAVTKFSNISRRAIFTYNSNEEDWYANERVFDLSGFRFLIGSSVEECKWNWTDYRDSVGKRLFGANEDQTLEDYRLLGVRENRSPCPSVNPGYVFDPEVFLNVPSNAALKTQFNYTDTNPTDALLRARKYFFEEGGAKKGHVLSPAFTITPINPPIRLSRTLPAEELLTNENNIYCPARTCEEADVLYALVREYNSDSDYPGTILRVTKVATPGENTCHVQADVNWDTMVGTAKKGKDKIPVGATGVQRDITFEFSLDMDPSDCTYSLEEAEVGKGYNILSNTPALYKPLEFAGEARAESKKELDEYAGEVSAIAQKVLNDAKEKGLLYRQNTYKEAQQIGGAGAPTAAQVQAAAAWPDAATQQQLAQKRLAAEAAVREGFQARPTGGTVIPPSVKELRALDTHAFGRDSARNLAQNFALHDMYAMPLDRNGQRGKGSAPMQGPAAVPLTPFETAVRNQTLGLRAAALHARPAQVGLAAAANEDARAALQEEAAYKYLRFRPLGTRSAAAGAVSIGRISFFYKGSELAIGQAKATNPMGDWGGSIADIVGSGGAGFHDPYKKALVLAFPLPILADGFSFTTARGARSAAEDPVTWKLEGSHNGTFWQVLHEQLAPFPVPMKRGENLPLFKF